MNQRINYLRAKGVYSRVKKLEEDWFTNLLNRYVAKPKTYKTAKDILKQVIDRKKKEGGMKHSIEYYAQRISQQFKGVDARILADMIKEENGAGDFGTPELTKRYKSMTPGETNEAKATYCKRCGTTHVPPSEGGKCPAVKEAKSFDQKFKDHLKFATSDNEKVKSYMAKKSDLRRAQNKELDPGADKKGLAISVVDRQKAYAKGKKKGIGVMDIDTRPGKDHKTGKTRRRLPEGEEIVTKKPEKEIVNGKEITRMVPVTKESRDFFDFRNQINETNQIAEASAWANAGRALNDYARKDGGIDKADFEKAAKFMYEIEKAELLRKSAILAQFSKFWKDLDTDVRDRVAMILKQNKLMEAANLPFDPDPKMKGPRKDRYGNVIKKKNIAKHLAKKGMNSVKEATASALAVDTTKIKGMSADRLEQIIAKYDGKGLKSADMEDKNMVLDGDPRVMKKIEADLKKAGISFKVTE